ncbi:MAG: RNA 2',3'-cyclic phosphodiesterase [Acidimicrobiia bacterium]
MCIELPADLREELGKLQAALRQAIHGEIVWPPSGNIHLTLVFLGNTDPEAVPRLARELAAVVDRRAPFTLRLEGTGAFPSLAQPRILWIGLGGERAALSALQNELRTVLATLGFSPEDRDFTPHLTLGRFKGRRPPRTIPRALRSLKYPSEAFLVREVTLMRSELGPKGSRYSALARLPLKGAGS